MNTKSVKGLTGVILSSPDPDRLADYYQKILGIPMQMNQHGNMPRHWECDYNGIHYAVLKGKQTQPNENIVLSFAVEDINAFIADKGIQLIHPLLDLGGGAYVGSFKDPDGNTLRLWMTTNAE